MTQYVSTEVSDTPPHPEPHTTVRDYRWMLKRFTNSSWTVDSVGFEGGEMEAVLSHSSGGYIQAQAIDPWEHNGSPRCYRSSRVRLRGGPDSPVYVTTDNPPEYEDIPDLFGIFEGETAHPFPDAVERTTNHAQHQVHTVDDQITDPEQARGYCNDTRGETILAIFAAAQRVTNNRQTGLDEFQ